MNAVVSSQVFDPDRIILYGSRCDSCASVHFPPLDGCPNCYAETVERVALSTVGEVRSFTVVRAGAAGLPREYGLVEVALPEGVKVVGQLSEHDWNTVQIGMTVNLTAILLRKDETGDVYGFGFTLHGENQPRGGRVR